MRFRSIGRMLAATVLIALLAGTGFGADWPAKPVKIIVPYAAGGAADITVRLAAQVAEKYLGQAIIVENRAGGGGVTGQSMGAKAKPDGYTLTEVSPSVIINPLTKKVDYNADSFVYIVNLLQDIEAIAVKTNSNFTTYEEFVKYAKTNPKKLRISVSGANNSDHLTALLFASKIGIKWTIVPCNGASQAITTFLGGHVDAVVAGPSELAEQVRSGGVKYIVAFAEKRLSDFPDIPTAREKGCDLVQGPWRGIAAPKGVPEDVINKIESAFMQAFKTKEFIAAYRKADIFVDTYQNRTDFNALVKTEKIQLTNLLKEIEETTKK